ncbi:hypothetical protein BD311DRAFT_651340 [Dichomitus squalens]|uniref:Uncharacterized protein n=1 Tax=Dichomitus squalens TaxID=114155 RepID=A0A4Q9N214_9APHY|nr:hypothetical protein BD311DRAFT_651340 [Dichomitus squalens]
MPASSANAAGQTSSPAHLAPAGSPSSVPPPPTPDPSVPANAYTTQFAVQPQPVSRSYYAPPQYQTGTSQSASQPYPAQATYYPQQPPPGPAQPAAGNYSFYGYPPNAWANAWNTATYQYPPGTGYSYSYAPPPQGSSQTAVAVSPAPVPVPAPSAKQKSPSSSPSLPPAYHKDWDAALKSFLSSIGFSQALRGFEADMLVLNPEWERKKVPLALGELMKDLMQLARAKEENQDVGMQKRPLDERKLDCVHLADGVTPRPHSSITKDISRFLAQNRARNDASNRNEFLLSIAEKRRRLNENGDPEPSTSIPSCARTDAKTQNRDLQMKYDIAKNEDGPLRRTMKAGALPGSESSEATAQAKDAANATAPLGVEDYPSAERYSGFDERLQNIEKHLAVRYVPSLPRSLLDRLKYLEDHIIHLEREYPPWAALHFNQPNRGWPPPPRATPIIVPSHLTSTAHRRPQAATESQTAEGYTSESVPKEVKRKPGRRTKSSLHRAVMEKLEVQRAMNDLADDRG